MTLKSKKYRNKILYKSFIVTKKNIQNRKKLNLFKLRKKKWKPLISYLIRLKYRRKKNFPIYDINRYFLPKMFNSFKQKFKYNHHIKKKIKLFYGGLRTEFIKNQVKKVVKRKVKLIKFCLNFNSFFLNLMESKLDIVLYRSNFVSTIQLARQLILHKHVKVNNVIVTNSSYFLKKGDIIYFNKIGRNIVELDMRNAYRRKLPPKYLIINYKTLQIIFNTSIYEPKLFSKLFSYQPDIYTLIKLYKKA